MVGVSKGYGIDSLIHLHELMCICADRSYIVLHCKVNIGSTHALVCLGAQTLHHNVLPLAGKASAAAELRKLECICAVIESLYLCVKALLSGLSQLLVIELHAEVDLVDNFKEIYLELHCREQRSVNNYLKLTVAVKLSSNVVADRSPQSQELNVVVLDKAYGAEIVQLFFLECERAEVVDLVVYLLHHFGSENNVLVAALEVVLTA